MPETYPPDADLLLTAAEPHTGVEHIPTGLTPYHLAFRRLVHRLSEAAGRSNDLRVYASGPLTIGVRGGRFRIADVPFNLAPIDTALVDADATTHVWLDDAGSLQLTAEPPTDPHGSILLAVVTATTQIDSIDDRRGETLYRSASTALAQLSATAAEIDQALVGIPSSVTASALTELTAGPTFGADSLHRHINTLHTQDALSDIAFFNESSHANAGIALMFALPGAHSLPARLKLRAGSPYVQHETAEGDTLPIVGSLHFSATHAGDLTAAASNVIGAVPIAGRVTDLTLSLGQNTVSSDAADSVSADVRVNGSALTTVNPSIPASAGAGFRSTARGDGTAATLVADPTVARGDLLTVDFVPTANGTVTTTPADIALVVHLLPDTPA